MKTLLSIASRWTAAIVMVAFALTAHAQTEKTPQELKAITTPPNEYKVGSEPPTDARWSQQPADFATAKPAAPVAPVKTLDERVADYAAWLKANPNHPDFAVVQRKMASVLERKAREVQAQKDLEENAKRAAAQPAGQPIDDDLTHPKNAPKAVKMTRATDN